MSTNTIRNNSEMEIELRKRDWTCKWVGYPQYYYLPRHRENKNKTIAAGAGDCGRGRPHSTRSTLVKSIGRATDQISIASIFTYLNRQLLKSQLKLFCTVYMAYLLIDNIASVCVFVCVREMEAVQLRSVVTKTNPQKQI